MKEQVLSIEYEEIIKENYVSIKTDGTIHRCQRKYYLRIKNFIAFFTALIALIILTPIFILVPIIIKIYSKGPVLFKHKRIGKNLKPFYIYKFRSMVMDADLRQKEL